MLVQPYDVPKVSSELHIDKTDLLKTFRKPMSKNGKVFLLV